MKNLKKRLAKEITDGFAKLAKVEKKRSKAWKDVLDGLIEEGIKEAKKSGCFQRNISYGKGGFYAFRIRYDKENGYSTETLR